MYPITCRDNNNKDIVIVFNERDGTKLENNDLKLVGNILINHLSNNDIQLGNTKINNDHILLSKNIDKIKKSLKKITDSVIVNQITNLGIDINHRPLYTYIDNNKLYLKYTILGEKNDIDTLCKTLRNIQV